MNKLLIGISAVMLSAILFFAASCQGSKTTDTVVPSNTEAEPTEDQNAIMVITAEEAKTMMDTLESYIIVDVREQSEYDAGHIEGAILVPVGDIDELAPELLPNKGEILLIYCRSGNRSAQAAAKLNNMGYTNIYDFGGIIDWPYEIITVE